MFYPLLRRLLFFFPPETAHASTLQALRIAHDWHLLSTDNNLGAPLRLMGLEFPNRVGLAAGFDKNGDCIDALGALGFGFLEVGTVTPRAQAGNTKPRLFRLPRSAALINHMGFPNPGVEYVRKQLAGRTYRGICGINIGKNAHTPMERAVDDYVLAFRALAPQADYVALNLSSPNTIGLRQLQQSERLRPILEAVLQERRALNRQRQRHVPILIKISPDMNEAQIEEIASLLRELKIDGAIATNTTIQRPGDPEEVAPREGGLSGMPLHPLSLATIRTLRALLPRPFAIVGVGGIFSGENARATLDAGADLIQLYTGLIYRGPALIRETLKAT